MQITKKSVQGYGVKEGAPNFPQRSDDCLQTRAPVRKSSELREAAIALVEVGEFVAFLLFELVSNCLEVQVEYGVGLSRYLRLVL
jgi:hypothetical protein